MKHLNKFFLGAMICAMQVSCSGQKGEEKTEQPENNPFAISQPAADTAVCEKKAGKIAYVKTDSLLLQYEFAKELNESLLKKGEKARKNLMDKQQNLQKEAMNFQKKYESGGFTSKEALEAEQRALMQKEQELLELDRKLSEDFNKEQMKLNARLRDSIQAFMKVFNADKRFSMILSDTGNDNIIYAEEGLNITAEVVSGLNDRYNKNKSKKTK